MVDGKTKLLKDWRIRILIASLLLLGIFPLAFKGLQFGMDFSGGSIIQLKLERKVSPDTMGTIVQILENRLNGFGLRDISVRPWEDQYIVVSVSEKEEKNIDVLKDVLSKQGRFEAIIDGQIALYSKDLKQIITNYQEGYGYISSTGEWRVPFTLSSEGANRFAKIAEGKCRKVEGETKCERIYMFIDRPQNAVILVPTDIYQNESEMRIDPTNPMSYVIDIKELEHNSLTKIIPTDEINDEVINEILSGNYTQVIIPEDSTYDISQLERLNVTVIKKPKVDTYWLWSALNLKSVLFLTPGVTSGEPITRAVITGHAPNLAEATKEMTKMVVILRSGRLPVSLSIVGTMSVSPTLGKGFLSQSVYIGLLCLLGVAAVVFVRYRRPKLTLAIIFNNICEVLIILGIASIINWQIDLPAMAGIIAALGTGVDHLIVISDEAIRGTVEEVSLITRIKRAFNIVLVAGFTTIAAMFPLMTLGLGMLKGFAITTMIGVLVGIIIVRPAFARIIEELV